MRDENIGAVNKSVWISGSSATLNLYAVEASMPLAGRSFHAWLSDERSHLGKGLICYSFSCARGTCPMTVPSSPDLDFVNNNQNVSWRIFSVQWCMSEVNV